MEEITHEIVTAIITALASGITAYFKRRRDLKNLKKNGLILTEDERDALKEELNRDLLVPEKPLTMSDHKF